jgi:GT2 family glycosyltransferase
MAARGWSAGARGRGAFSALTVRHGDEAMNWRWQKRPDEFGSGFRPPAADPSASVDGLIAQADVLRDARRWEEAAEQYQAALRLSPARAAIWVQLGNCRKEAGDRSGAEAAYRQSLELAPDIADTHLQLGHLLKLRGDAMAAIAAYARALRADRFCTPALIELIALGEGWRAEQESGLGRHMLGEVLRTADDLKQSLTRLERMLPSVASLTTFPIGRYDLFTTQYRLAQPPEPVRRLRWAVVVFSVGSVGDVTALLRSLADAGSSLAGVAVIASMEIEAAARQMAFGGVHCPITFSRPGQIPVLQQCDWVLAIDSGSVLVASAFAWLEWAVARAAVTALYADEDHLRTADDGSLHLERPVLKAAYDPEAEPPLFRHAMLALCADVAQEALAVAAAEQNPMARLTEFAAHQLRTGHLARILCHRTSNLPPPEPRAQRTRARHEHTARIAVIVPTRNGGTTLAPCIETLRRTAAEADCIEIIVLDNGSDEPATLQLLSQIAATGGIKVLRDDALFNWARLSNAGAAACTTEILLFLNDDVEIKSIGWDAILRTELARSEIGAVGPRLLYPDGGVQHAGMVFGPGGRVEHEGVATAGVPPEIEARWTTRRRVGSVTGAFLACRRSDFIAVGGFDEARLPIWFNDVDFCLKLRRAGRWILYAPEIVATHHESRTLTRQPEDVRRRAIWTESLAEMKRRWGRAIETDPGFNPYFARTGRPFEAMREPAVLAIEEHLVQSAQSNPWLID